jgi:hypothetical protein
MLLLTGFVFSFVDHRRPLQAPVHQLLPRISPTKMISRTKKYTSSFIQNENTESKNKECAVGWFILFGDKLLLYVFEQ